MTAVLEDVRHLPDADLIGAYRAADDVLAEAILSEAARRDRADRMAKARRALDAIRHDAECAVHAQYLAASEWTRGRLLSRAGAAAGIAERDLWRMPADRVARFGSEEVTDFFFFIEPRITVAGYVHARAAESRAARAEVLDQAEAIASDHVTGEDTTNHEHDQHAEDRPRLAQHVAGAFRFESPASEAPEAGGRGTVQRRGRGDVADASGQAAGRTGRPGGAVRELLRVTAPVVNGRQLTAAALDGRKLTLAWIPIN